MVLDGILGDEEGLGDLLRREAAHDEVGDLLLPWAEAVDGFARRIASLGLAGEMITTVSAGRWSPGSVKEACSVSHRPEVPKAHRCGTQEEW
jgi:hypothetical protein